jgi:hypothetical protein
MKKIIITPATILIVLLILLGMLFTSCSEEADPAPAARVAFTDADTNARYQIDADEFALFLFGADTLTFTSITPNPERIGTFDFDAVEGTPGKFKNASLYQDGQQEQGLSAGRLTITAFSGDFIELAYTVTFRTGRVVAGSYSGQIRPIK